MASKQAPQMDQEETEQETPRQEATADRYPELPEDHPVAKRLRALEEKVFGKHSLPPLKNDDRTKA